MDFKWEGQTKWKCSVNKNKLVFFYFDNLMHFNILRKINVHYQIKLIAKVQQIDIRNEDVSQLILL